MEHLSLEDFLVSTIFTILRQIFQLLQVSLTFLALLLKVLSQYPVFLPTKTLCSLIQPLTFLLPNTCRSGPPILSII